MYIFVFLIILGLGYIWVLYAQTSSTGQTSAPAASTAPILLAGVSVAATALIAGTWSQWQTVRITNALSALQTLRTDREYLINAHKVTQTVNLAEDSTWGEPLGPSLSEMFKTPRVGENVDNPSFPEAALFLLNQYEFLAAGTRSGAIDLVLVRQTLQGPIRKMLTTFSEQIVNIRKDNPRAFANLIWLHRTLSHSDEPYLGPRS